MVERPLMNDIPEVDLRTIEDIFGTSFERHADGEADAGQLFASLFPENAAQVESLTKLAARYRIPLIARGAGTAHNSGRAPRALAVPFDAMREIQIPESGEDWVEVDPGVTWMVLEERLRERGIGPTVYPTSAPRSTVGGASGFRPGKGERRTCRPVRHYRHRVGTASWPLLDARASVKETGRGSRSRAWYEGTCRLRIQRLGGSRND